VLIGEPFGTVPTHETTFWPEQLYAASTFAFFA